MMKMIKITLFYFNRAVVAALNTIGCTKSAQGLMHFAPKMRTQANKFAMILTACAAAVLVGCGGGGGGGGGGVSVTPPDSTVEVHINRITSTVPGGKAAVANELRSVAEHKPNEGSVTQSSRGDGTTTSDRVGIENAGAVTRSGNNLNITFSNTDTAPTWGTVTIENAPSIGGGSGDFGFRQVLHAQSFVNGTLYTEVYTDIDDTGADTDYVVGGLWLYLPDDNIADLEVGGFVDHTALTTSHPTSGTANYSGVGAGAYINTNGDDKLNVSTQNYFNIGLTANFGTSSVSGEVEFVSYTGTVKLEAAAIDSEGFFTGEVGDVDVSGVSCCGWNGNWGGQFYGDEAANVIGTFGGSRDSGNDNVETFIGIFKADKQ